MKRFWAALQLNLILQWRNRFYHVAFGVMVFLALGIRFLIPTRYYAYLLPPFMFLALSMTAYMFLGAMVLLEKSENSLESWIVTPLRQGEYLSAKVLSLAGLATLENALLVLATSGWKIHWLWLATGLLSLSGIYALLGFIVVVRYRYITQFLVPSLWIGMVMQLPLLDYFSIWKSPLLWVFPPQASLILMRGAFQGLTTFEATYGIVYSGVILAVLWLWAKNAGQRYLQAGNN
jgi:fluoroquinolone transport system permease protein